MNQTQTDKLTFYLFTDIKVLFFQLKTIQTIKNDYQFQNSVIPISLFYLYLFKVFVGSLTDGNIEYNNILERKEICKILFEFIKSNFYILKTITLS